MILYIFRHGETYFSKNKVPYKDKVESAEILPIGEKQAKEIGSKLDKAEIKTIYSSPIKRCVQTVEIIKKNYSDIGIIFDKSLEEEKISRGLEDLGGFERRMKKFLTKMKNTGTQKLGVCTHGWPIAALIAISKNGKLDRKDLDTYPGCGELVKIEIW